MSIDTIKRFISPQEILEDSQKLRDFLIQELLAQAFKRNLDERNSLEFLKHATGQIDHKFFEKSAFCHFQQFLNSLVSEAFLDANEFLDLECQFSVKIPANISPKKNFSGSLMFSKLLKASPDLRFIFCLEVCTVENLIVYVGVFRERDLEYLGGSGELFLPKKPLDENFETFNSIKLLNSLYKETEF